LIIPGIIIVVRYSLYAPVVLIEGLEGKSGDETCAAAGVTFMAYDYHRIDNSDHYSDDCECAWSGALRVGVDLEKASLSASHLPTGPGPGHIFVLPLISIVPALLYIKMRQLGGEPLSTALAQIEEAEAKEIRGKTDAHAAQSSHSNKPEDHVLLDPDYPNDEPACRNTVAAGGVVVVSDTGSQNIRSDSVYTNYHSDAAIPSYSRNNDRPITIYDIYYYGADRWGVGPCWWLGVAPAYGPALE
jgi:hypothetical protein